MMTISNHHHIQIHLGSFKNDVNIEIISFATLVNNPKGQPENVQELKNFFFLKSCIKMC